MNDRRAHVGWRAAGLWARQRFMALDQPLFFIFCGLVGLSLLAVYSASHHEPDRFLSHVRNLAIALTIMFVLAQVPANWLQKTAIPLYSMGLLLLIAVELFGDTSKGATRWLDLGVTRIQPSEIMKIAMPLMLAWVVHQRDGLKTTSDWVLISVLLLMPVALILRQPDLGTAILVAASGIFVIYLAGLPWRLIIVVAGTAVSLIGLLVLFGDQACAPGVDWPGLREYQRQRVCTLLDPTRDPLGKGFHILQSMIAVGSGGIWGKGWLNGTQAQLDFIPERETDFIFSGFAEEFGFLGALLLTSLYIGLILRGLWVSLGAPTIFGRLLAASIALTTFTYAFVNLGMVTGLLPVVGVPLPFVSYGGTALVTLGVGMGLIMSVARDRSRMTQGFSLQG